MNLPNEAIEAAAKALWEPNERDDEWVGEYETYKDYLRAEATKALEAASPYLLAETAKIILGYMEAWAGDMEIGFLQGFMQAAEEEVGPNRSEQ